MLTVSLLGDKRFKFRDMAQYSTRVKSVDNLICGCSEIAEELVH